jgi:hypothetical protein
MLCWPCISNYMKNTNSMHFLSSVYWVITPVHVSGVSAAHHQEVECIYVANGTCYTSELTVSGPGWNGTPIFDEELYSDLLKYPGWLNGCRTMLYSSVNFRSYVVLVSGKGSRTGTGVASNYCYVRCTECRIDDEPSGFWPGTSNFEFLYRWPNLPGNHPVPSALRAEKNRSGWIFDLITSFHLLLWWQYSTSTLRLLSVPLAVLNKTNTGRFIMFSVITKIYNK